jgi:hypothetical protein
VRGSNWEQNVWNNIWKLECPPKVHHFLWRIGHDSLPLQINIERRHIDLDTRYAICNSFFENGGHLFVRCSEAMKAWRFVSGGYPARLVGMPIGDAATRLNLEAAT